MVESPGLNCSTRRGEGESSSDQGFKVNKKRNQLINTFSLNFVVAIHSFKAKEKKSQKLSTKPSELLFIYQLICGRNGNRKFTQSFSQIMMQRK